MQRVREMVLPVKEIFSHAASFLLTYWAVSSYFSPRKKQYLIKKLKPISKEIVAVMKLIWKRMKIVIEPSCAVPLAVILKNPDVFAGKRVGIIIAGGNVDLDKPPWIRT